MIVGINYLIGKGYGAWHLIDGGNQTIAAYLRLTDALVQRFISINLVVGADNGTRALCLVLTCMVPDGLVTCLVQKIESSHTNKHHLQDGVPDKHSGNDAGKGL